jgi:hypothetical protein
MKHLFIFVAISITHTIPTICMHYYDEVALAEVTTLITEGSASSLILRGKNQDSLFVKRPVRVPGTIEKNTLTLNVLPKNARKHTEFFMPKLTTIISRSNEQIYFDPNDVNNGLHIEMRLGALLKLLMNAKRWCLNFFFITKLHTKDQNSRVMSLKLPYTELAMQFSILVITWKFSWPALEMYTTDNTGLAANKA